MHAIDLAKLQEDKYSKGATFSELLISLTLTPLSIIILPYAIVSQPLLSKPHNNIPIKKFSPSELQNRREKGLCYTCDEKFIVGHKCKSKYFLLVHQEDTADELTFPMTQVL